MSKTIIYKIKSFPTISETFIVNSIVRSIDEGFEIIILVDQINPREQSSQPELIDEYQLMNRVLRFEEPTGSISRKFKAIWLLINPVFLFYFVKYCKMTKMSLSILFELKFYSKFRNNAHFHVHFADNTGSLLLLKKIGFLKSQIIVTFHGYDAHFFSDQSRIKDSVSDYKKYVQKVTVNSTYLQNVLLKQGFDKGQIDVLPIGIDCSFYAGGVKKYPENQPVKLITIGRLVPLKGQAFGILATKLLLEKGENVTYTIIGSGEAKVDLIALIEENDLKENVFIFDEKQQQEIRTMLADHDIFLMTSITDDKNRKEAYGVVSLEAQAMGLPVIGFNSGGVPETVIDGKTGFIVEEKDVEAMARKIEIFVQNKDLFQIFSRNAIEHICSKFDIKQTMKGYLNLYRVE